MSAKPRRNLVKAVFFASRGLLCGLICVLGGCVTDASYSLNAPPPYMVLPVDEMMSCDAMTSSFYFSARRAARLEYWMAVGPPLGYGYERFWIDAPVELVEERRRLDALSDLQRYRGCPVLEPGPVVVAERAKLEGWPKQLRPRVVLRTRG
jgi:hypothetical protein